MKKSAMTLGLIFALSNAFAVQDVLNIKISNDGEVRVFEFKLMPNAETLNKSTMKDIPFDRSSGDCTGIDFRKIADHYSEGAELQVLSSPEVDGSRMFQLDFFFSKMISIRPFQLSKDCSINFINKMQFQGSPIFSLKRGEVSDVSPPDLPTTGRGFSVKAEWR